MATSVDRLATPATRHGRPAQEAQPERFARFVRFVTLGCAKNEVDTDKMRAALRQAGYSVSDEAGEGSEPDRPADVVVVNTCSFITEATQESIDAILALLDEREARGADTKIVVAGCMPARYGDELAAEMPEVDAFLPVADEKSVVELVERLVGGPLAAEPAEEGDPNGDRTFQAPYAYVKISDGCDRNCAFCTIPRIRGHYASRSAAEVLDEVDRLVGMGVREVILIGQDTGIWGDDLARSPEAFAPLPEPTLAALIGALAEAHPDTWLRVMYLQPQRTDDALLATMAAHGNICNYLDIPLQHCNARVLRDMNRAGSPEEYRRLLERVRAALGGDVTLRTTFIAGFPGETDEEARELVEFVEEAGFELAGVFAYSQEDGTVAGERPDQVPDDVKVQRAQELRDAAEEVGFARAAAHIGELRDVLVCGHEELDGGAVAAWGRTMFQAPDVDGTTIVFGGEGLEVGAIMRVRITGSVGYDLEGELA